MTERQTTNNLTGIVSFEEYKTKRENKSTIPDGPVNTFRIYPGPSKEIRDANKTRQKKLQSVRKSLTLIQGGR